VGVSSTGQYVKRATYNREAQTRQDRSRDINGIKIKRTVEERRRAESGKRGCKEQKDLPQAKLD
jgi:hypothetical protein